jgi:hypothetical protein
VGTEFDVSELSRELAALRARPHAHKFAFILPLAPGLRDTARAFLAEGPLGEQAYEPGLVEEEGTPEPGLREVEGRVAELVARGEHERLRGRDGELADLGLVSLGRV